MIDKHWFESIICGNQDLTLDVESDSDPEKWKKQPLLIQVFWLNLDPTIQIITKPKLWVIRPPPPPDRVPNLYHGNAPDQTQNYACPNQKHPC